MIRIVDLFNKSDRNGKLPSQPGPSTEPTPLPPPPPSPPPPPPPPQPKPAPEKLTGPELDKLFNSLIVNLKFIAGVQTPPAEAAKKVEPLLADLGSVVEQQILGNPGILPALDRRAVEPVFSRALKKSVRSLNIALDANYTPDQLTGIALAALLSVVEAGGPAGAANPNRLAELACHRVKLDEEACRNILNLAELYENMAPPAK